MASNNWKTFESLNVRWRVTHQHELQGLLNATPFQHSYNRKIKLTAKHIVTTKTTNTMQTLEIFWMKATASIVNFTQNFCYIGCNKCFRAIPVSEFRYGRVYDCKYCKQTVTAEARCRFDVQLQDETGHITTNCFGQHAERLFSFTATDLKQNTNEDGMLDKKYIVQIQSTDTHMFKIKPYDLQLGNRTQRRHIIIHIENIGSESSTSTP